MTQFWFISAPLFSHLDWGGFLKTAQVLKARGHDVTWISGAEIGGAVTNAGLAFAPIRATGWLWPPPPTPDLSTIPPQEAVMLRYRRALDTWMSVDLVADAVTALRELADEIGKPDVIVTDPFITAAALAAELLDVPLAVCGWIAQRELNEDGLFPVQKILGQDSQERLASLCDTFGLQGVNFAQGATPSILSPHLHVSYFNRAWYAADEDTILPQTLFVGGKPDPMRGDPPSWLSDIPADAPIALITLGTTFTGDLGFFSWAAHAAARTGHIPIVCIGTNPISPDDKATLKAALPKTTRLLNYVPFGFVLPRTRIIAHHGGMGTTHTALIHGVPQIVVPHAADQRGQARRAAQAKVGLNLTAHDVQQGLLLDAFRALSTDETIRANARTFADDLASLGGAAAAADALEKIV